VLLVVVACVGGRVDGVCWGAERRTVQRPARGAGMVVQLVERDREVVTRDGELTQGVGQCRNRSDRHRLEWLVEGGRVE